MMSYSLGARGVQYCLNPVALGPRSSVTVMKRTLMKLLSLAVLPALLLAQDPATQKKIADLEAKVNAAQSAGDNAWMLMSCALVLMMTGPGLALFYGGLVQRRTS